MPKLTKVHILGKFSLLYVDYTLIQLFKKKSQNKEKKEVFCGFYNSPGKKQCCLEWDGTLRDENISK